MNWPLLQQEVSTWALHNFGPQDAWQPMLGLIEEVGEFLAAREHSDSLAFAKAHHMEDALADQAIYALNLCEICNIRFGPDISFPNNPEFLTDAQLTGSLAAACHAVLKEAQGIRGYDKARRREEMVVALSMWFRWASAQHMTFRLAPLLDVTLKVWEEVKRRDWRKNPVSANEDAVRSAQSIAFKPDRINITASKEQAHYFKFDGCPDGEKSCDCGAVEGTMGAMRPCTRIVKMTDDLQGGK